MKKMLWGGKITQEKLRSFFYYNQNTGRMYKKKKVGSRGRQVGGYDVGNGSLRNGYHHIGINGKQYIFHRIVWLYMEGFFPEFDIDHINGNKADNRWMNLRHVSRSCNLQNCTTAKNNISGYTGVWFDTQCGKWVAKLMVNGKTCYLGRYDNQLDAAIARIAGEEWHPDFICDERNENRKRVLKELKKQ